MKKFFKMKWISFIFILGLSTFVHADSKSLVKKESTGVALSSKQINQIERKIKKSENSLDVITSIILKELDDVEGLSDEEVLIRREMVIRAYLDLQEKIKENEDFLKTKIREKFSEYDEIEALLVYYDEQKKELEVLLEEQGDPFRGVVGENTSLVYSPSQLKQIRRQLIDIFTLENLMVQFHQGLVRYERNKKWLVSLSRIMLGISMMVIDSNPLVPAVLLFWNITLPVYLTSKNKIYLDSKIESLKNKGAQGLRDSKANQRALADPNTEKCSLIFQALRMGNLPAE